MEWLSVPTVMCPVSLHQFFYDIYFFLSLLSKLLYFIFLTEECIHNNAVSFIQKTTVPRIPSTARVLLHSDNYYQIFEYFIIQNN